MIGCNLFFLVQIPCKFSVAHFFIFCSIYTVHDEVKDKEFELELSWVGEGKMGLSRVLSSTITCTLSPPTH